MRCLSGLSPTSRVVNTYGAIIGSGNILANAVASNVNTVRTLGSRNIRCVNGGVIIVNTNNTTATVRIRTTLSNIHRLAVFGHTSRFCTRNRRAIGGLHRHASYVIGVCPLRSRTGLGRRLSDTSVCVSDASYNVGPLRSIMTVPSGSCLHPSLIIVSAICTPHRAGLVG